MTLLRLPGYVGGEPAQPVPRDVVAVLAEAGDGDAPAHWMVGFWVHDADALAAQAPELGGSVLAAPSDAMPMRQAVLADPAGAVFSVTTAPGPRQR
jgi:predicted enzyme related to lactoylglutathione lyase